MFPGEDSVRNLARAQGYEAGWKAGVPLGFLLGAFVGTPMALLLMDLLAT